MGRDSVVGIATRYCWTIRRSIPGEGEIFRARPDRSWGPPSLLYSGYRVSFPGVKRPGRGADHPPPPKAEVKEFVALYLYARSRPSWRVPGRTFAVCNLSLVCDSSHDTLYIFVYFIFVIILRRELADEGYQWRLS